MNSDTNYVDKTVLRTPEPTASSTIVKKKMHRSKKDEYCLSSEFDSNHSLGLLSINSDELGSNLSYETSSEQLRKQRVLANISLQKASRLSGLPSRYLKSSGMTKLATETCLNMSSNSTISETDLLKSKVLHCDTSTPRSSITVETDPENPVRYSLGKSITELSNKIQHSNIELDTFAEEFQKVMQSVIVEEDSDMFTPAEAAEAKLIADEMSWRKENDIPGQMSVCFTEKSLPLKVSMGEFFRLRSENISDLDIATVSPEKKLPPVPLVMDLSTNYESSTINSKMDTQNSLSVSKIAQLLEDIEQTPQRATNYLLNEGKKISKKIVNPSVNVSNNLIDNKSKIEKMWSGDQKLGNLKNLSLDQLIVPQRISHNKENINSLNIQNSVNISSNLRKSPVVVSANTSITSRKSPDFQANTDRSVTSVRSTSSLSNLINGKLPIDATKTELLWGCVKPGKSVSQEVVIRNKSQSRLRIMSAVSGPSYKILKDRPDAEYVSIARYVLQPGESKSISISFAPIQLGAAIDCVSFAPVDTNLHQYRAQKINLYGYGGYATVDIGNVTKDITGKFWLCLGELDNKTSLYRTILVQNTGTLPAFGCISFESKDMYSFCNISINPQKFTLQPQEQKEVTVTYTPSRNDMKYFHSSAKQSLVEIGILRLISGSEVNRGRIRKLCKQAAEKGLGLNQVCENLIEPIPGEAMPSNLYLFKETIKSLTELLQELSTREIVLTLEQDPESTLLAQFPDDTLYFQTLTQDSTINIENADCNFKLEPNFVILTPPIKVEDMLLLTSEYAESVPYEIKSDSSDLIIYPSRGVINPGETVIVKVKYLGNTNKIVDYKLSIIFNTCILDAIVKVVKLR